MGPPNTYDGHVYGEADQKVRFYLSPILLRGKIFDGNEMHRIIPIEEYGPEFNGLAGVHVYTYMNEEPYSYSPEQEDCENPIIELGIDADYSFFVSQGADEAVVTARIMSVMYEIHEIYEENFSLDIRVVGPYIRTVQPIPDLLVLPISNIQGQKS